MAPFLFIIQILVYAGAVIVLIVFVIMLLNLQGRAARAGDPTRKFGAGAMLCALAALLLLRVTAGAATGRTARVPGRASGPSSIADVLVSKYVLPLEIVAVILPWSGSWVRWCWRSGASSVRARGRSVRRATEARDGR
ncbi:MAG: NADH-quinone oxidoreductase subunit J [Candidatus Eisenbacteria bacterium]